MRFILNQPGQRARVIAGLGAVLSLCLAGCGAGDRLEPGANSQTTDAVSTATEPTDPIVTDPWLAETWVTSVEGVDVTFSPPGIVSLAEALNQAVTYPDGRAFSYGLDSARDLEIREAVATQLVLVENIVDSGIGIDSVTGQPQSIEVHWVHSCPAGVVCDQALRSTSLHAQIMTESPDAPDHFLSIGPPEGANWVYLPV